jgi:hypothetical protein
MAHETEEQRGGDDRDEPTVPRATELNYTTDDAEQAVVIRLFGRVGLQPAGASPRAHARAQLRP